MSGRVGGFLGRLFGRSASRGRTKVVASRNDLGGGRAEQELAEAMGELGNIAKGSSSVEGLVYKTPEEIEKKARQGDANAQYNYGLLLQNGHDGVEHDARAALRMIRDAAHQKHPWARFSLAHAFSSGVEGIIEPDLEEAFNLFHLASQANIPEAFAHLGNMYENGIGTEQNVDEAVKYYMHAAELGDDNARAALAKIAYDKQAEDKAKGVQGKVKED